MELCVENGMLGLDFSAEIDEGVAWLDGKDPRWYANINLDKLELWSTTQCVLGQLAMNTFFDQLKDAGYGPGYDGVLALDDNDDEDGDWARQHGFYVDHRKVAILMHVCVDDLADSDSPMYRFIWERLTYQWDARIRQIRRDAERAIIAEHELEVMAG